MLSACRLAHRFARRASCPAPALLLFWSLTVVSGLHLGAGTSSSSNAHAAEARPNVVVILTDDK